MWARGEAAHVLANAIRFGDGAEFLLPLHFGSGVHGGIAAKGFRMRWVHGVGIHGQDQKAGKEFTHATGTSLDRDFCNDAAVLRSGYCGVKRI